MTSRLSDVLQRDHREIESYYDLILASTDAAERREYQNQFTWELARHAIGEELVVYPAFEKYISDGAALAKKDRAQHQEVRYCSSLSTISPSN